MMIYKYTAADFGLKNSSMLMEPNTGAVHTAQDWLDSTIDWSNADGEPANEQEINEQFCSLIEVQYNTATATWEEVDA